MIRVATLLAVASVCAAQTGAADRVLPGSPPAILWRDPGAKTTEHWICGPGGCERTPAAPFQFVSEDLTGSNPKLSVKDANGRDWNVKFGGEVIPETFGSRFVTAVGYLAEPVYYVGEGKLAGDLKLRRARRVVGADGTFRRARFELRNQPDLKFMKNASWRWDQNPFLGTRELAGLKIVVMLLSNWDVKDTRDPDDSNNGVFRVNDGGQPELFYSLFDWGASLGLWGSVMRRDRSDCAGFARDTPKFVRLGEGNTLEWGFEGKHPEITSGITGADVRWLLPYLERITPAQLTEGLKASGATDRQAACWAWAIGSRMRQLSTVAGQAQ